MDAGAVDASRRAVRDVTIVRLHVDGEPVEQVTVSACRPRRSRVRHRVGMLAVCALGLATGWSLLDSGPQGVELDEIERSVGSDLSGELLGDVRVTNVRCVRRTQTDARCVAELFDKSGEGPILQPVTVRIEQQTGDYSWQAGAAH